MDMVNDTVSMVLGVLLLVEQLQITGSGYDGTDLVQTGYANVTYAVYQMYYLTS